MIKDISILITESHIHLYSPRPLNALSSGVVGGGFQKTRHILNLKVDKNYAGANPAADLRRFAREKGIHENFIGMMTAASVGAAVPVFLTEHGLTVGALVTMGMSNAACAGVTPPFLPNSAGTINIILLLQARLSRAALVNAVITATEAKTAVLSELGYRAQDGHPATGTSTDSMVIAAANEGDTIQYAGTATLAGWLIARAVRQSISQLHTKK
ncbi:MAG: adenosylcobinamide amidohydrolase [Chloroflexota bacterium]